MTLNYHKLSYTINAYPDSFTETKDAEESFYICLAPKSFH